MNNESNDSNDSIAVNCQCCSVCSDVPCDGVMTLQKCSMLPCVCSVEGEPGGIDEIKSAPEKPARIVSDFEKALTKLINLYSIENRSDTPDFVLARFVHDCLHAYSLAVTKRDYLAQEYEPIPELKIGDDVCLKDPYDNSKGVIIPMDNLATGFVCVRWSNTIVASVHSEDSLVKIK